MYLFASAAMKKKWMYATYHERICARSFRVHTIVSIMVWTPDNAFLSKKSKPRYVFVKRNYPAVKHK